MPDINTLIKKSDYGTKIAEIESKYVSNTGSVSKLAQANVITKRNFDAKIIEFENNKKNLQTFNSSYFRGKSPFEEDGVQKYLVFQPMYRYFKMITNAIMFHHGNLKDYQLKVLKQLQHLIIVILQH